MALLVCGLLLWSLTHYLPTLGRPVRTSMIDRLGENAYKGLFSILMILSIVLIVYGWKGTIPTHVYAPPAAGNLLAAILMLLAFILFVAGAQPTRIKQLLRHPQLTSVVVFSAAHLLVNGDSRSLLLFTWLAIWALVDMALINRRDGAWEKPPAPGWAVEARLMIIAVVIFVVMVFVHPYLSGVPLR